MKDPVTAAIAILATVFVLATIAAAYVQHFITAINGEQWVVLVIGAIMPPLGVLHGILVWLGVF